MKTQSDSDGPIIRSGTRIRESIRCLPKGHFQQIRQMFDKQSSSTKTLSTIHEQRPEKHKALPSCILLRLPVTDDEKLQHNNTIDDLLIEKNKLPKENYLSNHPVIHTELTHKSSQLSLSSLHQEQPLFESTLSRPIENDLPTGRKDLFLKINVIICLNVRGMLYLSS